MMTKRKPSSTSAAESDEQRNDSIQPDEWGRVLALGLPALRKRRRWSQKDLARRSVLSQRTIASLEQPDEPRPRPLRQTLMSLARAFGYVHLADLWNALQGALPVDPGTPLIVDQRIRRIVLAFMDCTPQEQQLVESIVLGWSARHQADAAGQTLDIDLIRRLRDKVVPE